jgi:hypothetical protein
MSNALTAIDRAKNDGALMFINVENFQAATELYKTETTLLVFKPEDFHNISGKYMPKKETTDRIGEAAGVAFIAQGCKVSSQTLEDDALGKRTVYIGSAQGKVRMPDGSWRTSSVCEYEFDPTLRACLDNGVTELNAETKQARKTENYGKQGKTTVQIILEYSKVAWQRANTGARLRVIRELTGMPTAFTKEDISKPMMFGRIVQNTSYILSTPEGRTLATAQALGLDMAAIFGGKKSLLPSESAEHEPETLPAETTAEETMPSEGASGEPEATRTAEAEEAQAELTGKAPSCNEFETLTAALEEWREAYQEHYSPSAINLIDTELNNPDATPDSRRAMIGRTKDFLKKLGVLR